MKERGKEREREREIVTIPTNEEYSPRDCALEVVPIPPGFTSGSEILLALLFQTSSGLLWVNRFSIRLKINSRLKVIHFWTTFNPIMTAKQHERGKDGSEWERREVRVTVPPPAQTSWCQSLFNSDAMEGWLFIIIEWQSSNMSHEKQPPLTKGKRMYCLVVN